MVKSLSMWHVHTHTYLKASIVKTVNTNPIIERVTPIMEMTSRAIAFAPPNLQSSSVLEQMSCIHIKIALWISLLTWGTFSMLLTTRAAKLVKCEQLHTISQDPGENTVSQPWFIQSENVKEWLLILHVSDQQIPFTLKFQLTHSALIKTSSCM